jgi:hypothetical protein
VSALERHCQVLTDPRQDADHLVLGLVSVSLRWNSVEVAIPASHLMLLTAIQVDLIGGNSWQREEG